MVSFNNSIVEKESCEVGKCSMSISNINAIYTWKLKLNFNFQLRCCQAKPGLTSREADWFCFVNNKCGVCVVSISIKLIKSKWNRSCRTYCGIGYICIGVGLSGIAHLHASRYVSIDRMCSSFSCTSFWLSSPPNLGVSCSALARFSTPAIPFRTGK